MYDVHYNIIYITIEEPRPNKFKYRGGRSSSASKIPKNTKNSTKRG